MTDDTGDRGAAITQRVSELIRAEYPDADFVLYVGLPADNCPDGRNRRGFCTTSLAWDVLPNFLRHMADVHEQERFVYRPWTTDSGELS